MSPNPTHVQLDLDIPIPDGDSPWSEESGPYDGAIPEFTGEEVENAFPTCMVEAPIPEYQQIVNALLKERNVLRPTHEIALWIRREWQR
jgi:hypothetical protein